MPRLSIIIPHRNDHQLEETILSVLENRPRDCEIIVVHDGSYCDPYRLEDEVVYVEEEPNTTLVQLLNAGLMAACSPVVCTLLDGMVVSANWSEPVMKRFAHLDIAAVAPKLQVGPRVVYGIGTGAINNVNKLRSGQVESLEAGNVAPTLSAGFYRRKVLLALGGWNDEAGSGSADVELAFLMNNLNQKCECEPEVVVRAAAESIPSRNTKSTISELAGIAAAYGLASASVGATLLSLLAATLTGNLKAVLAWLAGLKKSAVTQEAIERLAYARKQLSTRQDAVSIKIHAASDTVPRRNAA